MSHEWYFGRLGGPGSPGLPPPPARRQSGCLVLPCRRGGVLPADGPQPSASSVSGSGIRIVDAEQALNTSVKAKEEEDDDGACLPACLCRRDICVPALEGLRWLPS